VAFENSSTVVWSAGKSMAGASVSYETGKPFFTLYTKPAINAPSSRMTETIDQSRIFKNLFLEVRLINQYLPFLNSIVANTGKKIFTGILALEF
jgi:hypothetical protein